MPMLELTDQEINIVLNILALQNPLIAKISKQMQEQNDGSITAERRAPNGAGDGSGFAAGPPSPRRGAEEGRQGSFAED